MLRTIIRSDDQSYPWLAPAGTRRGNVDNISALGYIDSEGEFKQTAVRQGSRDTLYENNVNPLTFIPGTGLVNYGNKTTKSGTALDRINVSRLVSYIRSQVDSLAKQFLFEPNDKLTRDELKGSIEKIMNDLIAKRGLYDYLVVCDGSNNTPSRIDRSELYVDIAIEPVKAVEFIFIPVRIKNTGEISNGS
jgi:phage tail sheath protein FI